MEHFGEFSAKSPVFTFFFRQAFSRKKQRTFMSSSLLKHKAPLILILL